MNPLLASILLLIAADERFPAGVYPGQSVSAEREPRVILFTASWCVPCKTAIADLKPWLTASGWSVGQSPRDHVQIVDIDQRPEFAVRSVPSILLVDGQKRQIMPYACRQSLVDLLPVQSSKASPESAPTPHAEIVRILGLLPEPKVGFVDFGCGSDARWCVVAAERWPCQITGVEIDHERAASARERVKALGLSDRITIIEGDAATTDVTADVGTAYLYSTDSGPVCADRNCQMCRSINAQLQGHR